MCGRYSLFSPREEIETRFDAEFSFDYEPRYNAAPSQDLPVITGESPSTIQRLEWGLIPNWADSRTDHGHINARAETLSKKRSFAEAYESRRCLVPADGFYEWVETSDGKQPYRVALPDDDLFAMAGLYERWEPPQRQAGLCEFGASGDDSGGEDDIVESFTIVTTEPNETVADLHHRMAVILDPDEESTWLRGSAGDVSALLDPYDAPMQTYPVSSAVNSPANDSPELIEPAG
ncbi:SOS response-associated peptidase [Haloarcula sp. Atlit-7R]|uniref:SOS response-associated peptidase n=1 Tax=Haloarcula sp. Atlit-7R TaxID=2282125 RepID=UPI000EF13170|nr:SOS response-associated peptidase [Haloarcula sp. Atlit-7R]RLN01510.1 SOS response-associated peptidase [Haloarcula sp. Atlit-7R]